MLLQQMPNLPGGDRDHLEKHLRALLEVKNLAEYESRLLAEADAKRALDHMRRVLETIGPRIH